MCLLGDPLAACLDIGHGVEAVLDNFEGPFADVTSPILESRESINETRHTQSRLTKDSTASVYE
jgi:hypothetical protein